MDWSTQPDPFRRYVGAELLRLDQVPPTPEPFYDAVFRPEETEPRLVDRASVSQLFYDSLSLSAWKELGASRWSLRVNPSSGNLHPTEGYLLAGPISDLTVAPGLYHYSPFEHGLEVRTPLSSRDWSELTRDLPPDALLVGLTSILWRESWKYGERAFRYCHHDVGHAIASVALAASGLGWRTHLLTGWTDRELAVLLGVSAQSGIEAEHPDCLLVIHPATGAFPLEQRRTYRPPRHLLERLSRIPMSGEPNQLSSEHHLWAVIDEVAAASSSVEPPADCTSESLPEDQPCVSTRKSQISARQIIRQRRSAVALDGRTGLDREIFFGMLERVRAIPGRIPFDSLPWDPVIYLVIFVHRVNGLEPGLYCFTRSASAPDDLKAATRSDFDWSRPIGCPEELPFYRLARGDCRDVARIVSCNQEIASDGAFALAMVAEFEPCLREYGTWFYRRLHWEAGAVGQVLYLEAEAAGVRSTGIGCFFDDALHKVVGLEGRRYQKSAPEDGAGIRASRIPRWMTRLPFPPSRTRGPSRSTRRAGGRRSPTCGTCPIRPSSCWDLPPRAKRSGADHGGR
jgi:SagB-type dehydrogenase family enzyme